MSVRTPTGDIQLAEKLAAQYLETYEREKLHTPTEFAQRFLAVEKEIFAVLNPVQAKV